jgi:hypothetical protein
MAKLRPIIRPIYQEMGIIPATENLTEELAEEEIAAEQIQA